MKSDEELRHLAREVHRGAVFCSMQMREGDSDLLPFVFMPLLFLDDAMRDRMREEGATVLYGNLAGAVRQINGYPCLTDMGWLNDAEWQRVALYVALMEDALNAVVGVSREENPV